MTFIVLGSGRQLVQTIEVHPAPGGALGKSWQLAVAEIQPCWLMTDSTTLHILGTIIIQELGIRIPITQGNKHPQQLTQAPLQDDSVLMDLGMAARLDRGDLVTWCFPVARLRGVYGGEKQGISTCNNWSGSRWGINLSWEYQMRWNKMWFLETRGPPRWKPHGENIGLLILETPTPSPVRLRYCWVILSHTVSKTSG